MVRAAWMLLQMLYISADAIGFNAELGAWMLWRVGVWPQLAV